MSTVPKETIKVIAPSIGINNLSSDVALALAPDVEYHVREIMQAAIKCMRHSKRTILTADDVDSALNLRNVEPIYGFASGDPLSFKRAVGHNDLFYIDDQDAKFKNVIEAPIPRAPLDTVVVAHWLAIEGVQPAIPENAPVEALSAPSDNRKFEHEEDGLTVEIKLPITHVLSRELQLYFDKITELTVSKFDSVLFKEALASLATDSGLHPLVPYFTYFVSDEVTWSLNDFLTSLFYLLSRAFFKIHTYTLSLMFGHVYHNLQPPATRTLLHAFLDPTKALTQHYDAIQGLAALGPRVDEEFGFVNTMGGVTKSPDDDQNAL